MHNRLLTALVLLTGSVFATQVHAQTCAALQDIKRILVTSANCTQDSPSLADCRPEIASTLVADLEWAYWNGPHCPVQFEWFFSDGRPSVITDSATLEHVFPPSPRFNAVWLVTVQPVGNSNKSAHLSVRGVWGSISIGQVIGAYEGGSPARVAFTRTDSSRAVTIPYYVQSYPNAYIDAYHGSVTLATGEARKEVAIPVKNDDVYRSDKAHGEVTITTGNGGWKVDEERTTFTIVDDDPPPSRYTFVRRGVTVSESAGSVTLQIAREGNPSLPDTVIVSVSARTYEVPFAAGQTLGNVTVAIENDSLWSTGQRYRATCQARNAPPYSFRDEIDIEVLEDEPLPYLTESVIEVSESDATRFVPVPLEWRPALAHAYFFHMASSDGLAKNGEDYAAIAAYGPLDPFGVTIIGDNIPESDETFTINFAGAVSESVVIRILDDDRPPFHFAFESPRYDLDEGGGTIGIIRTGATSSPATVTMRVVGRIPASWTIPEIPIAFAAGETVKRVTIATDDGWFTNGREGSVELEWEGFTGASAPLTLRDDEPMPVLSLSDADALEGAPGVTGQAEFVLSLSAPVGADLFLTVATEEDTATASDYTPLAAKRVHIAPGVTRVKVPVTILGDDLVEGTQTFALRITSCCGGFAQLANATATGTIRESGAAPDGAVYRIEATDKVNEGADWLRATVTRRGDTSGRSVATVKLTADASRHFSPVSLHFAPGQTSKDVRFAIDDSIRSGDAVALLEVFAGARRDDKRHVTIKDDELQSVIRVHDLTVLEPRPMQNGQARFVVTIEPPSFEPITVELETAGVTATPSGDFFGVSGIHHIPALASRYEVPVIITNRGDAEPTETFTLTLRALPQTAAVISVAKGTGTCSIVDYNAVKLNHSPSMVPGTTQAMTLEFPDGAFISESLRVTSSDPAILSVPDTIAVTAGTRGVTFEAAALQRGTAKISIALSIHYFHQVLTYDVSVDDVHLHVPIVQPAAMAVEAGSSVRVQLFAAPLSEEDIRATLAVADGSIAMVENAVTIPRGGHATFDLAGATPGQTELLVTLESAAGGTTLRVPVVVTSGAGKRRGARH